MKTTAFSVNIRVMVQNLFSTIYFALTNKLILPLKCLTGLAAGL